MDIEIPNEDWEENQCPWNRVENTQEHKCAYKGTYVCPYFMGIERKDTILCVYPHKLND